MNSNCRLLSVIIPVYNTKCYIERAVCSVKEQTYENIEIIIIDDGSTDGSGELCDKLAKNEQNIKVIHKNNAGQSKARNMGIDISKGEYIAFLDSDDYVDKRMYEILISLLENSEYDIAECASQDVDELGHVINGITKTGITYNLNRTQIMESCFSTGESSRFEVWNKVYRAKLFCELRFKPDQVYEEIYILRKTLGSIEKITYIDQTLHYYTKGRAGSTTKYFNKQKLCVFGELEEFLRDKNIKMNAKLIEMLKCLELDFAMVLIQQAAIYNADHETKEYLNNKYRELRNETRKMKFTKKRYVTFLFEFSPMLSYKLNYIKQKIIILFRSKKGKIRKCN